MGWEKNIKNEKNSRYIFVSFAGENRKYATNFANYAVQQLLPNVRVGNQIFLDMEAILPGQEFEWIYKLAKTYFAAVIFVDKLFFTRKAALKEMLIFEKFNIPRIYVIIGNKSEVLSSFHSLFEKEKKENEVSDDDDDGDHQKQKSTLISNSGPNMEQKDSGDDGDDDDCDEKEKEEFKRICDLTYRELLHENYDQFISLFSNNNNNDDDCDDDNKNENENKIKNEERRIQINYLSFDDMKYETIYKQIVHLLKENIDQEIKKMITNCDLITLYLNSNKAITMLRRRLERLRFDSKLYDLELSIDKLMRDRSEDNDITIDDLQLKLNDINEEMSKLETSLPSILGDDDAAQLLILVMNNKADHATMQRFTELFSESTSMQFQQTLKSLWQRGLELTFKRVKLQNQLNIFRLLEGLRFLAVGDLDNPPDHHHHPENNKNTDHDHKHDDDDDDRDDSNNVIANIYILQFQTENADYEQFNSHHHSLVNSLIQTFQTRLFVRSFTSFNDLQNQIISSMNQNSIIPSIVILIINQSPTLNEMIDNHQIRDFMQFITKIERKKNDYPQNNNNNNNNNSSNIIISSSSSGILNDDFNEMISRSFCCYPVFISEPKKIVYDRCSDDDYDDDVVHSIQQYNDFLQRRGLVMSRHSEEEYFDIFKKLILYSVIVQLMNSVVFEFSHLLNNNNNNNPDLLKSSLDSFFQRWNDVVLRNANILLSTSSLFTHSSSLVNSHSSSSSSSPSSVDDHHNEVVIGLQSLSLLFDKLMGGAEQQSRNFCAAISNFVQFISDSMRDFNSQMKVEDDCVDKNSVAYLRSISFRAIELLEARKQENDAKLKIINDLVRCLNYFYDTVGRFTK